ncbi:MAG: hypothetical protein ACLS61_14785 [Ruminococcus sp.]
MKLGIVYTSTTPELIECVNEEIKKSWRCTGNLELSGIRLFWQK